VTADGRRATLYWCEPTPGGNLHVEARGTLENEEAGNREHHRPSVLGRGPTLNAAQRPASFGHDDEEYARRFARRVPAWLGREVREGKMERVVVFAAPRFLGLLRGEVGNGLRGVAELEEAELTRLRAHELAEHPAVVGMVKAAAREAAGTAQRRSAGVRV
jgi:protein required for attachment to host cells